MIKLTEFTLDEEEKLIDWAFQNNYDLHEAIYLVLSCCVDFNLKIDSLLDTLEPSLVNTTFSEFD